MTTTTTANTETTKPSDLTLRRALKKRSKDAGRKKRQVKLQADKAFAKTFFDAKSKRSDEKKVAFRKKKTRKK